MKYSTIALLLLGAATLPAHAATLVTLGQFTPTAGTYTNGAAPGVGLIADSAGNLFGTTNVGGTAGGGGTVFELTKSGSSYSAPTAIASFSYTGGSGSQALSGLTIDAAGNLFGTTYYGGTSGKGTVYEIAKSGGSYGSITTLANFNTTNGSGPDAGLVSDAAGNLFGTTQLGGSSGNGTVFEIAKSGGGYGALTTLANLDTASGTHPTAPLAIDSAGNLFGQTQSGGTSGFGTVFEIAKTGGSFGSVQTLANLAYVNGRTGGLTLDGNGNLFGTTNGGGSDNSGTLFEVPKTGGAYSALTTILSFNHTAAGGSPNGGLLIDAAGDIFGGLDSGGNSNSGAIFKVTNTAGSYSAPVSLVFFSPSVSPDPNPGLIADASGNIFGTTYNFSSAGEGSVFEITSSGYQTTAPAPEPASLGIFGLGVAGLAGLRRRRAAAARGGSEE